MKRKITLVTLIMILIIGSAFVYAAPLTHTVRSGDSMWRIALKYQVGISELIQANPQIKNPDLIYPGQNLTIPEFKDVKALENEVVRLVNIERSNRGLGSLQANWQLSRVARYKSTDMRNLNYFSHTSPTYGSPFKMMEDFGLRFTAAGENIAMGQETPKSVMTAWMNSPGHRSNILSSSFSEIGVGVAKDQHGRIYWTQMFMRAMK